MMSDEMAMAQHGSNFRNDDEWCHPQRKKNDLVDLSYKEMLNRRYQKGTEIVASSQWPFQEPKLEVPTIIYI